MIHTNYICRSLAEVIYTVRMVERMGYKGFGHGRYDLNTIKNDYQAYIRKGGVFIINLWGDMEYTWSGSIDEEGVNLYPPMRRYRCIKDSTGFKAGTIYETNSTVLLGEMGWFVYVDDIVCPNYLVPINFIYYYEKIRSALPTK